MNRQMFRNERGSSSHTSLCWARKDMSFGHRCGLSAKGYLGLRKINVTLIFFSPAPYVCIDRGIEYMLHRTTGLAITTWYLSQPQTVKQTHKVHACDHECVCWGGGGEDTGSD